MDSQTLAEPYQVSESTADYRSLIMYPMRWQTGKPLVSVIAICHNHAPFVLETLESIRKQTYANVELIIINNLRDSCGEKIFSWLINNKLNARFIQNITPKNVSENVNMGVYVANGQYIQIISCDDILMPDKLETQAELFQSLNHNCVAIVSRYIKINAKGDVISNSGFFTSDDRYIYADEMGAILATGANFGLHSALLRRDIFFDSGGANERYQIEDYYLWCLFASMGCSFYFLNKVTVKYRILKNSLWQSRGLNAYEDLINIRTDFLEFLYGTRPELFRSFCRLVLVYIRLGGNFTNDRFFQIMRKLNIDDQKYLKMIKVHNWVQTKMPKILSSLIFWSFQKIDYCKYLFGLLRKKAFKVLKTV